MIRDLVLIAAALAGVAAVLATNPVLSRSMQLAGVAYVVWTGTQPLRALSSRAPSSDRGLAGACFRQALLIKLVALRLRVGATVARWLSRLGGLAPIGFGARIATE